MNEKRERYVHFCSLMTLSASVVFFPSSPVDAQGVDVPTIYRTAARSVAVIISLDRYQQPLSYGSGFFLDARGALATNYHVIEGAHSIGVKLSPESDPLFAEGVVAVDTLSDLAVVKVPTSTSVPLPLSSIRPTVGEPVIAIGNPLGLESTVSEGIISGIRRLEDRELYQITTPISPGSSGGPVLNLDGDVVGVATASLRGGQNINFAVPSATLASLLEHATGNLVAVAEATRPKLVVPLATGENVAIRIVDVQHRTLGSGSAVVYNGSQFDIRKVHIRVVCWKDGVDVPIGYDDEVLAEYGEIPAGLSRTITYNCRTGTNRPEFRILGYEIVRD